MTEPERNPQLGDKVHVRHVSYDLMTYEPIGTSCVLAFVTGEDPDTPALFVMAPDATMSQPAVTHDVEGADFTWHWPDEFHGSEVE